MAINVRDILSVWDWVQKRRLKTIIPEIAKQPNMTNGLPCPLLQSVSYYPFAQIGEPFPVVISACNIGSQAFAGGITVSFPDITRNGQGGYVEVEPSNDTLVLRQEGDEITSSDISPGQKFQASYLLRETEVMPWNHNEEKTLKLKITPVVAGALRFYVTVWLSTSDWKKTVRTPISKDVTDQQGHAVYPYVVNVLSTK